MELAADPIILEEEKGGTRSISSQDIISLEKGKGRIVEGITRRKCPICGNTNNMLIHETIDRTHIISSHPRLYGKKYHYDRCVVEWRVPLEW